MKVFGLYVPDMFLRREISIVDESLIPKLDFNVSLVEKNPADANFRVGFRLSIFRITPVSERLLQFTI
jgi:hypothetical protein